MKMKAYGPRKWLSESKVGVRMFLKKNSERQHSSLPIHSFLLVMIIFIILYD